MLLAIVFEMMNRPRRDPNRAHSQQSGLMALTAIWSDGTVFLQRTAGARRKGRSFRSHKSLDHTKADTPTTSGTRTEKGKKQQEEKMVKISFILV
jgi:hypothetical protein